MADRERIRDESTFSAELGYLGESREAAYAYQLQCVGPEACQPDQSKEAFTGTFRLLEQDLRSFEDSNISFKFFHTGDYVFEQQLNPGSESLFLEKSDGSDFLAFCLWSSRRRT